MKSIIAILLPLHVTPSPWYPSKHSQVKLPSVSVHWPLLSQLCLGLGSSPCGWHSLMLVQVVPFPEYPKIQCSFDSLARTVLYPNNSLQLLLALTRGTFAEISTKPICTFSIVVTGCGGRTLINVWKVQISSNCLFPLILRFSTLTWKQYKWMNVYLYTWIRFQWIQRYRYSCSLRPCLCRWPLSDRCLSPLNIHQCSHNIVHSVLCNL